MYDRTSSTISFPKGKSLVANLIITNKLLPAVIDWQVGGAHLQHSGEGDRMGTAVEEEREDPLQHLVGVEHILGTVLHQILELF